MKACDHSPNPLIPGYAVFIMLVPDGIVNLVLLNLCIYVGGLGNPGVGVNFLIASIKKSTMFFLFFKNVIIYLITFACCASVSWFYYHLKLYKHEKRPLKALHLRCCRPLNFLNLNVDGFLQPNLIMKLFFTCYC